MIFYKRFFATQCNKKVSALGLMETHRALRANEADRFDLDTPFLDFEKTINFFQ